MSRIAFVFGQFGAAADPLNLPNCEQRVKALGVETILVQHTDSQRVYDFLHGYSGFCGAIGSSLGAGAVVLFAKYLKPQKVHFLGGFQPSVWDPVMTEGNPPFIAVPDSVAQGLCFRNPVWAITGGLGYATWKGNNVTKLDVIEREDVHPGDFGEAQDQMVAAVKAALEVYNSNHKIFGASK